MNMKSPEVVYSDYYVMTLYTVDELDSKNTRMFSFLSLSKLIIIEKKLLVSIIIFWCEV